MLELGLKGTWEREVTYELTAQSLGSGALPVFGTPYLVALMEGASIHAIDSELPEGKGTVGVDVDIHHLSATPIGMTVRAESELVGISENGKMLTFRVSAYDEKGLVGEGTHVRAIITNDRFMEKAQNKLK